MKIYANPTILGFTFSMCLTEDSRTTTQPVNATVSSECFPECTSPASNVALRARWAKVV